VHHGAGTNVLKLFKFASTKHRPLVAFFCCLPLASASVFGEDALVNVSVEKKDDNDGKLAGYIRIRSKTQGIALSLGDRITSVQRGLPEISKH
jgi:coatomer subunit beta